MDFYTEKVESIFKNLNEYMPDETANEKEAKVSLSNPTNIKKSSNFETTESHVGVNSEIESQHEDKVQPLMKTAQFTKRRKKIVLIGDSLLELGNDPLNSFPLAAALSHAFRRRADVINRAFSGYTSKWIVQNSIYEVYAEIREEMSKIQNRNSSESYEDVSDMKYAKDLPYSMFIILLGSNDSILPGNLHHVPVKEFEHNVKSIVETLQILTSTCREISDMPQTDLDSSDAHDVKPAQSIEEINDSKTTGQRKSLIVLVTPPPCSIKQISFPENKAKFSQSAQARSNQVLEKYVETIRNIGKYYKTVSDQKSNCIVETIDLYEILRSLCLNDSQEIDEDLLTAFLADGVHLNGLGYKVLFVHLMEILKKRKNQLVPLPMIQPHYSYYAR